MRQTLRIFRGRILPLTIALIAGAAVGLVIAGMPDSGALLSRGDSPDLTVKPGALIDPSQLTVPPELASPGPVPPTSAPAPAPAESTTIAPATSVAGDGLRPRAETVVIVSNGNGANGLARTWANRAVALGYSDPNLSTARTTADTVVYFAEGFEGEARRLADELATTPITVRPIAEAPVTTPPFDGNVLLMLGKNLPTLPSS